MSQAQTELDTSGIQHIISKRGAAFERLHEKTFNRWLDAMLQRGGGGGDIVSSGPTPGAGEEGQFIGSFYDGIRLIRLVEILSGKTAPKYHHSVGKKSFLGMENIKIAMDMAAADGVKLEAMPRDIQEGNRKAVLGTIWQLMHHYQLQKPFAEGSPLYSSLSSSTQTGGGTAGGTRLLDWLQMKTKGYPNVQIKDLHHSWLDGMGFLALIHSYDPSIVIDHEGNEVSDFKELDPYRKSENLANAFDLAERHLGIPRLLDADDLMSTKYSSIPDEQCLVAYLSFFPMAFMDREQGIDRTRGTTSTTTTTTSTTRGGETLGTGSIPSTGISRGDTLGTSTIPSTGIARGETLGTGSLPSTSTSTGSGFGTSDLPSIVPMTAEEERDQARRQEEALADRGVLPTSSVSSASQPIGSAPSTSDTTAVSESKPLKIKKKKGKLGESKKKGIKSDEVSKKKKGKLFKKQPIVSGEGVATTIPPAPPVPGTVSEQPGIMKKKKILKRHGTEGDIIRPGVGIGVSQFPTVPVKKKKAGFGKRKATMEEGGGDIIRKEEGIKSKKMKGKKGDILPMAGEDRSGIISGAVGTETTPSTTTTTPSIATTTTTTTPSVTTTAAPSEEVTEVIGEATVFEIDRIPEPRELAHMMKVERKEMKRRKRLEKEVLARTDITAPEDRIRAGEVLEGEAGVYSSGFISEREAIGGVMQQKRAQEQELFGRRRGIGMGEEADRARLEEETRRLRRETELAEHERLRMAEEVAALDSARKLQQAQMDALQRQTELVNQTRKRYEDLRQSLESTTSYSGHRRGVAVEPLPLSAPVRVAGLSSTTTTTTSTSEGERSLAAERERVAQLRLYLQQLQEETRRAQQQQGHPATITGAVHGVTPARSQMMEAITDVHDALIAKKRAKDAKRQARHEAILAERERLQAEEERMKAVREKLAAEQERLRAEALHAKAEEEIVALSMERLKLDEERERREHLLSKQRHAEVTLPQEGLSATTTTTASIKGAETGHMVERTVVRMSWPAGEGKGKEKLPFASSSSSTGDILPSTSSSTASLPVKALTKEELEMRKAQGLRENY